MYIERRARIFIGGSKKHTKIAIAIQENLNDDYDVEIWDDGAFKYNKSNLDNLIIALDNYDFAILALTADDILHGPNQYSVPRDNVIFELGLFMGRLGLNRTYFLCPATDDIKLPSDLNGISYGRYPVYANGNLKAALRPICEKIRELVREIGIRKPFFSLMQEYCEVDIYYNRQGLNTEQAHEMALELKKYGIRAWAKKHDIDSEPDAIFIGSLVSAENVRFVIKLLKNAYKIKYIFRTDYPSSEGGDENGYKIGIGYISTYNEGKRSKLAEPIKLLQGQLEELINPDLTNTDFQRLLHKITNSHLDL